MNTKTSIEKLKTHEMHIKKYESLLMEQAKFLRPHAQEIAKKWSLLYLETFGRSSFFSPERVEKVHKDMVDMFMDYLNNGQLGLYLEKLANKGNLFAGLGVPFEEIIISVHLFEESCLPFLLECYTNKSQLYPILIALEELHHSGLVVLASSYFFNMKRRLEHNSVIMEEENKKLKENLSKLTSSYFTYTKKELGSMRLLISSINTRLKEKITHLKEINYLNKLLQNEYSLTRVVNLALNEFSKNINENTAVAFSLFSENGEKLLLFSNKHLPDQGQLPVNEAISEIKMEDIPSEFIKQVFNKSRPTTKDNIDNVPAILERMPILKQAKNFLLLPIKGHNKPIGFLLAANLVEDKFSKEDTRFYAELTELMAFSVQRTMLFNNLKDHTDFLRLLDKLNVSLLKATNIYEALDIGIDIILQALKLDRCSIMLLDNNTQELCVSLAKGINAAPFGNLRLKIGQGIAGRVVETKESIQVAAIKSDHRFIPSNNAVPNHSHVKSLLCVPLKIDENILGVINMASISKYRTFSEDEITMIHDIAERISIGLIKFTAAPK